MPAVRSADSENLWCDARRSGDEVSGLSRGPLLHEVSKVRIRLRGIREDRSVKKLIVILSVPGAIITCGLIGLWWGICEGLAILMREFGRKKL